MKYILGSYSTVKARKEDGDFISAVEFKDMDSIIEEIEYIRPDYNSETIEKVIKDAMKNKLKIGHLGWNTIENQTNTYDVDIMFVD